jgi:ABC-type uncharacterized transport system fused permease/ATPase subunit
MGTNNIKVAPTKKGLGNIDSVFMTRLLNLLKIVIPSWNSSILFDFLCLNLMLVIRSLLSIRISEVNGMTVKAIINVNWSNFLKKLLQLGLISVPAAFTNSLIEYLNKKIALKFRENLTKHFHKHYINDMMFHHVGTIDGRISNPDQRLTQDLDKWATSLSNMYSNISKPILDIVLFGKKLSNTLGYQGPLYILGYYAGATII